MFIPPVKAVFPSVTRILRWLRKINRRHTPWREQGGRQKRGKRHVSVFQFVIDARPRIARAGGVNQDAHLDAAFRRVAERLGKLFAAGVVVENIRKK